MSCRNVSVNQSHTRSCSSYTISMFLFLSGHTFEGGEVEAYTMEDRVDYPRDPTTEEITASIHAQLQARHDPQHLQASVAWPQVSLSSSSLLLQDKDFKLLKPGDPIFMKFSGETVTYEGEELYSVFINECAYYEKKIAFLLGEKIRLDLPPISVKRD